jgi:uncharacterized membrane protein YhaH (DUF805 family)
MSWLGKIFGFQGRLSRGDFWIVILLIVLGVIAFQSVAFWYFPPPYIPLAILTGEDPLSRTEDLYALVQARNLHHLVMLLLLWPWLAAGVKRCHDRGKSGLWLLLFWVPVLGWLWGFIELGLLSGDPRPNRYGPSSDYGGDVLAV